MNKNENKLKDVTVAVAEGKNAEIDMLKEVLSSLYLFKFNKESMKANDFAVLYAQAPFLNREWATELWKATNILNNKVGTKLNPITDENYVEAPGGEYTLDTHINMTFDEVLESLYSARGKHNV